MKREGQRARKRKDDEDEDVEEDEGVEEEEEEEEYTETKKASTKKASTKKVRLEKTASLVDSDKWRISSGERVRTSSGELRLNPSLTTVAFAPVHRDQGQFLKIVSWNVNGLRSVLTKSSIARYLLEEAADIVCLQETKTNATKKDGVPDLSSVAPGFTAHWDHAAKPGYAGVATLTRTEPVSVRRGIGVADFDGEGRTVTLEFGAFFVVNSYWPNSGDKLKNLPKRREWNKAFSAFVLGLKQLKPVVVVGDLNVAPHPVDLHNRSRRRYDVEPLHGKTRKFVGEREHRFTRETLRRHHHRHRRVALGSSARHDPGHHHRGRSGHLKVRR